VSSDVSVDVSGDGDVNEVVDRALPDV